MNHDGRSVHRGTSPQIMHAPAGQRRRPGGWGCSWGALRCSALSCLTRELVVLQPWAPHARWQWHAGPPDPPPGRRRATVRATSEPDGSRGARDPAHRLRRERLSSASILTPRRAALALISVTRADRGSVSILFDRYQTGGEDVTPRSVPDRG